MDENTIERCRALGMVGVRVCRPDESYQVGDYARPSLDWDHEHDCPAASYLDGTSAVAVQIWWDADDSEIIDAIDATVKYAAATYGYGSSDASDIVLLGGDKYTPGEDQDEIVIKDAEVLAILRKSA